MELQEILKSLKGLTTTELKLVIKMAVDTLHANGIEEFIRLQTQNYDLT
jgi:hypothetical protein